MSISFSTVVTEPISASYDASILQEELLSAVITNNKRSVQILLHRDGLKPEPIYRRNGEIFANPFHEACQKLGTCDQARGAREILVLLLEADPKGLSNLEIDMFLLGDTIQGMKPTKAIHCAVAVSNFDLESLQFLTHLLKRAGIDEYSERLLAVKNLRWNGYALEIKGGNSPFQQKEEILSFKTLKVD